MKNKEIVTRDFKSKVEVRELEDGKRTITGFIPYNSRSEYMGYGFYEYVGESAFSKTLADHADVKALVNHDSSKIIGRVKNGTLRLESREDGLYAECDLPVGVSYADDLYNLIKNDYVTTMSFGMRILHETYGQDEVGIETHTLTEVALIELSWGCTFPAYSETKSEARSLDKIGNILDKDELTDSDKEELRTFIDELSSKLEVREEPVQTEVSTEAVEDTSAEEEDEQLLAYKQELEELKAELSSLLN